MNYSGSEEIRIKKNSYTGIFIMAAVLGAILSFVFIGIGKIIIFLGGLIIKYWMYAAGGIVGLFILKKIIFRRRKKKNENSHR